MRIVRPIRIRSGRFDGAEDFSRTVQLHVMGVRYAAVDLFSDADGCGQAQFRAAYGHVGIRAAVLGHQRTGRFGEDPRSEEHTSELQSRENLVCRLLLEKKK